MLATVGDLIEDITVSAGDLGAMGRPVDGRLALNVGADTETVIRRRRGGSAANVAVAAARQGAPARFIGCVGDDPVGDVLLGEVTDAGVEATVQRRGRTATIIVVVHPDGERSMLTDRGSSITLSGPRRAWLSGVKVLHLPLYSLAAMPLADTVVTLVGWAHEQAIGVSVDLSATSLLEALGPGLVGDLLVELRPAFVFANEAEAEVLGASVDLSKVASVAFIEKCGSRPARVVSAWGPACEVPAYSIGIVTDSTGAGDAFAAGFLVARMAKEDLVTAARLGHRSAADHLRAQGAVTRPR